MHRPSVTFQPVSLLCVRHPRGVALVSQGIMSATLERPMKRAVPVVADRHDRALPPQRAAVEVVWEEREMVRA